MTVHVRCKHCGARLAEVMSSCGMPAETYDRLLALTRDATVSSAILRTLIRHFGQNVPTEMIVAECYGSRRQPPLTVENTLRVRISALRHVVGSLGLVIINERYPCTYRLDRAA